MARDALEPGEVGKVWFEYYRTEHELLPDGSQKTVRVRLPKGTDARDKEVSWVTARARYRTATGEYRELSQSGKTKGQATRALDRKIAARATDTAGLVKPTWTIEQLAEHWLSYRKSTGLSRKAGDLRPSSYRQMSDTVRVVILGDRKTRGENGAWAVKKREGGIADLRVFECTIQRLEGWLTGLEARGLSTKQARSVLTQMLDLAVRDGALSGNPMSTVAKTKRAVKKTPKLTAYHARLLRTLVAPQATKQGTTGRTTNPDLAEVVDFCLGTGCRIGEVLAARWCDLHLDAAIPFVVICGTMVEGRDGLDYHRYPARKNDDRSRDMDYLTVSRESGDAPDLTLFLPDHLVEVLRARRKRVTNSRGLLNASEPVFANSHGGYLWANNLRTRLRNATAGTPLAGMTPHRLRKLVATEIERAMSMEDARHQLGHGDPTVTGQSYVEDSMMGPDARVVLQRFFEAPKVKPREAQPRTASVMRLAQ